jgi:3-deoxy-D-manno-octulosonate 8-phosphate phosphatase (KDO 8-P phosphatase)
MSEFLSKLTKIKAVFLDVDGVLTDGSVVITEDGDMLRNMSIKDGYALQLAVKKGIEIIVITGGTSSGVVKRLNGLGIHNIFTGVSDKISCLNSFISDQEMDPEKCLYVGDDVPDIDAMKSCGLAACPCDASHEVKEISRYISPFQGGKGCVRDVLEKLLRVQNLWNP